MISSLTLKLNNFIRNEKVKETTERGTEFTKVNEYRSEEVDAELRSL